MLLPCLKPQGKNIFLHFTCYRYSKYKNQLQIRAEELVNVRFKVLRKEYNYTQTDIFCAIYKLTH